MNNITYSIIIPHKNSPDLLKRCINSIPKRDDVQIIIIDDNSSKDIVDFNSFPGLDIKSVEVFFTKTNRGAGYARNIGLKHAGGKWLLFADADDYYAPNFLDIIDANIQENIDILFYNVYSTDIQIFDRASKINQDYDEYFNNNDVNIIKFKNWAPWNKVVSRRLVEQFNLSFDEIPVGNDAMFSLNASCKAKEIKVIPDRLYCVTHQPQSITYKPMTSERIFSYSKINIKINKFLLKLNLADYQIAVTSPYNIYRVYKEKGIKYTFKYMKYISDNYSLLRALCLYVKIKNRNK